MSLREVCIVKLFQKKKKVNDLLTIEDLEKSRDKIKIVSIRDKKILESLLLMTKGLMMKFLKI